MRRTSRKKKWVNIVIGALLTIGVESLGGCTFANTQVSTTSNIANEQKESNQLNHLLAIDNSKSVDGAYGDLYFICEGKEPELIANNVLYSDAGRTYKLSQSGRYIAYVDINNDVYVKDMNQKAVKLGRLDDWIFIRFSLDEHYFSYSNYDSMTEVETLYVYELGDTATKKAQLKGSEVSLGAKIVNNDLYYVLDHKLYRLKDFKTEEFLLNDVSSIEELQGGYMFALLSSESAAAQDYLFYPDTNTKEKIPYAILKSEIVPVFDKQLLIYSAFQVGELNGVYFKLPGQEAVRSVEDVSKIAYSNEEHILYYLKKGTLGGAGLYATQLPTLLFEDFISDRSLFEKAINELIEVPLVKGAIDLKASPNRKNILVMDKKNSVNVVIKGKVSSIGENILMADIFDDYLIYLKNDYTLYMQKIEENGVLQAPVVLSKAVISADTTYEPASTYSTDEVGSYVTFIEDIGSRKQLIKVSKTGDKVVLIPDVSKYNAFILNENEINSLIYTKEASGR